jgi:hypothetical protein
MTASPLIKRPLAGWPAEATPRDIARVLGVSEKSLRAWLRRNAAVIHVRHERWLLTPGEAARIVALHPKGSLQTVGRSDA